MNPYPGQLSINSCTQSDIENNCHGIGTRLAERIVDERANGIFSDWRNLLDRVPGIGVVKVEELKDRFQL